jgi:CheY-like chemotaxis protein
VRDLAKLGAIPHGKEQFCALWKKTCFTASTVWYTSPTMILLVEDEAEARNAFAQILRNQGYVVMEAADGLEALNLLEQRHFDLVITDILMPNLNGFALVARIRVKWPNIPIVLTSAYLSQEAAKTMLNGSVDFIPKPIDPDVLMATVQRLLHQSGSRGKHA